MLRFLRYATALAVVATTAGTAAAGSFELPASVTGGFAPSLSAIVQRGGSGYTGYEPSAPRNEAIRYRDRGYRRNYGPSGSPVQLHVGFFDPDGDGASSFVVGLRGGPQVDPHVQIGGMLDWVHRTENSRTVAGEPFQSGGTVIVPERVLSRATTNLFPMMLFLQVSGDDNMPIIPYGGISGGYEVLTLSADDFNTGESFDGTFGAWGWQAWLGAGIPLSGQARVTGELFVNQSQPEREVTDPTTGQDFREIVDMDGVGMRFGLAWGF